MLEATLESEQRAQQERSDTRRAETERLRRIIEQALDGLTAPEQLTLRLADRDRTPARFELVDAGGEVLTAFGSNRLGIHLQKYIAELLRSRWGDAGGVRGEVDTADDLRWYGME